MAHQRHCTHMHNVLSHSWNNVALHYLFVGVDTISSSSILKCTKSCNMCWIEQLTNAASNCECLPYQLLPRGFAVYQAYVNAMRLCAVSFLLVLLCVSFGFCQHMSYGTCCSIYDWFGWAESVDCCCMVYTIGHMFALLVLLVLGSICVLCCDFAKCNDDLPSLVLKHGAWGDSGMAHVHDGFSNFELTNKLLRMLRSCNCVNTMLMGMVVHIKLFEQLAYCECILWVPTSKLLL
jgi:hypothetical protein